MFLGKLRRVLFPIFTAHEYPTFSPQGLFEVILILFIPFIKSYQKFYIYILKSDHKNNPLIYLE